MSKNSGDGAMWAAVLLGLGNLGQWLDGQQKDAEIVRLRGLVTDLQGKCNQLEAGSRQRDQQISGLERENAALKDEIARLKTKPAATAKA